MERELRFLLRFRSDAARVLKATGTQFKKLGVEAKVVSARLKGVAANLARSGAAGSAAGTAISGGMAKASAATARFVTVARGLAATLATVGLGFGLIGIVSVTSSFGSAMSRVQAITGELARDLDGNLNPTFVAISDTIRNLGATTVFTASQAAQAFALLSQAGFSAGEAIQATVDVLNLAIVGAIDLSTSANIVANSIRSFGLSASEANRVADVFATTITSTNTNVTELGEALKFVGPIASSLGISIEETAAAVGVLSDAGLKGTLAGTGLRRVMIGLASQTPKATKTLKEAGVVVEDLQKAIGKEGLTAALKEFEGRTLSAAEAVDVFGLRGGPAFLVLQRGAERTGSLTKALEEAEGRALKFAEVARDNLAGDLRLLKSVTDDLILGVGTLNNTFRDIVQTATGVFQVFNGTLDPLDQNAQRYRDLADIVRTVGKVFVILIKALIALKVLAVVTGLVRGAAVAFVVLKGALGGAAAGFLFLSGTVGVLAAALAATGLLAIIALVGLFIGVILKLRNEVDRLDGRLEEVSATIGNLGKVVDEAAKVTGDLAIQQLPALERAAKQAQKQFSALTNDIARLREEAEEIKSKGLLDVFKSEQLTLVEKLRVSFLGLAFGTDAAGEAARTLGQKAARVTEEGLVPLAEGLAKFATEAERIRNLQAAKDELTKFGNEGKALSERLSEATKVLGSFRGAAEKSLEKLNIKIGDLSLGVGDEADLQRKVNKELRKAKLEIEIPAELTTVRADAAQILIDLEDKLRQANELSATQQIDNSDAIIANLQVQVVQAQKVVAGANEAIDARINERNQVMKSVAAVFALTEANKKEEEQRKKRIKDLEKQAKVQDRLAVSTGNRLLQVATEIELLGASDRERKKALLTLKLTAKAQKAGLEGLSEQQKSLLALLETQERLERTDVGAALSASFKNFVDESTNIAGQVSGIFENVFSSLEDAIVEFTKTGEFNFRQFAAGVAEEFLRLGIRLTTSGIFEKLAAIGTNAGGAAGGGGGGFGLGSIIGAIAGFFDKGGLASNPPKTGLVPAAAFAGAPGFQFGGSVGGRDTIPAMLSPGERVLSKEQNRDFESGRSMVQNVTINIQTPDVAGFARSRSQIQAQLSADLARANDRNG